MSESKKPHWWNAAHDLSWDKVKATLVEDWAKVKKGAEGIGGDVHERALQFGHGAREAYHKFGSWTVELEAQLKADWEQTHKDAGASWVEVKDAIKHGWERTTKKA